MTDIPLPSPGDTSWSDWGTEQEELTDRVRQAVPIIPAVTADGVTDDRAVIQAALDGLPAEGGTVWLPGLCYVGAGATSGGAPIGVVIPKDNVTLTGAPGAGLVSDVSGIRLLIGAGHGKTNAANPYETTQWLTSDTPWTISGTVAEGATSITLATPANAANLTAGDLIFIRTGQLVDTSLSREPDSELNEVVTSNSGTGVITLKHPTAKAYAQEYYITGTTGFTSTSVTANPAPYGVVKATGRVLRNITIRGLKLWQRDTASGTNQALQFQAAWGVLVEDCDVVFGKYGIGARYARGVRINKCRLHTVGTSVDNDPSWIAPSTGCGDWVITSGRGTGITPAKIHAHEGVHDLHFVDWQSATPNGVGQSGASNVSVRQRAYRHVYDLDMTGSYTTTSTDMVNITVEVVGDYGQVYFPRLRLRGTPGRSHLYIASPTASINGAGLDLPAAPSVTVTAGLDPVGEMIAVTPAALSLATGTPTLEVIGTNGGGTAWLLDPSTVEGVTASLYIPPPWRAWQIEVVSQATSAPAGGADVVRFQPVYSQGGGSSTTGSQASVTFTDTTTALTTVLQQMTITGSINLRMNRLATNAGDTYAADARLRAIVARRIA